MQFEVYQDEGENWRWRVRSHNGQVTAGSVESFDSKQNAGRAAASLIAGIRDAQLPPRIVTIVEEELDV